jgi:hypothetical protein
MGDFSEKIASKNNLESLPQSKFIVFDKKRNHIKTIELKYGFSNWIADVDKQRLIIYFNDKDHLLGYIDLAEILP